MGITINEAEKKLNKAKKDLNILDEGKNGPICDGDYTIGLHRNIVEGNNRDKEGDRGSVKAAFPKFVDQPKITKP